MYIVESINEKPAVFFYAVFKKASKAKAHLSKLKKKTKGLKFRLVKAKIKRYPVFIAAKGNKISYYSKKELIKKLDKIISKKEYKKWDKDYQLFTIYKIEKSFAEKEGYKIEFMHYHADKKFIGRFKKYGKKIFKTK